MLRHLCQAVGFSDAAVTRAEFALARLFDPWGNRAVHPHWISDITEDHSAVEFSISTHNGQPEVRMMIEAQGNEPTLESQYEAGVRLTERIAKLPGVSLERFHQIKDIFRPGQNNGGRFGLWHSICFRESGPTTYKVYFNPLLDGGDKIARAKVEKAMKKLYLGDAYAHLMSQSAIRDESLDVPKYFALDLTATRKARIKLYMFHRFATAQSMEHVAALGQEYVRGETSRFVKTVLPGHGTLGERPLASCFSYRDTVDPRPFEVNVYAPVCAYALDDEQIRDRIIRLHRYVDQGNEHYVAALESLARRPLRSGIGLHSYVACSRRRGTPRITVYISPELRKTHTPGTSLGSNL